MWQPWKPAAFLFLVLGLCSWLGGSWMAGFLDCAGLDQFLDSGCSGCWENQGWALDLRRHLGVSVTPSQLPGQTSKWAMLSTHREHWVGAQGLLTTSCGS